MDYRLFAPGTTVAWFPVVGAGRALLSCGDGHACLPGRLVEIVGTSAFEDLLPRWEVTFRILKRTINWPRGETAEDIFAVGNARPLGPQALLLLPACHYRDAAPFGSGEDYGLDPRAAQPI